MHIENLKASDQKMQLHKHLAKANRAVDLAVKELITTRGGQIVRHGDEWQFLIALSGEKSAKRLRTEIKEYLTSSRGGNYHFKESSRDERIGNIRPTDLVIAGHFSSETLERFIVVDLKGKVSDDKEYSDYVRFEAWCRLYYLPNTKEWFVHYVDIIIRHKSPAQRALFMFECTKSGDIMKATEKEHDDLCLFFESLQGGTWG